MKTIKYILIAVISLLFISESVTQNSCELDHLVPVRESTGEGNDTLLDLTPPPPPDSFAITCEEEGDRLIYFIHGLNGSEESWTTVNDAVFKSIPAHQYPGFKVDPFSVDYFLSQGDLGIATTAVSSQIRNYKPVGLPEGYDYKRGIAFGHSQGGIVGRALDKHWSEKNYSGNFTYGHQRVFGGLVTLATPNQGAQILNNKDFIRGFVYDLADNLTAGPYREFKSSSNYFVRLMASLVNLGNMRNQFVNFIGTGFGSFLIAEGMPGITKEYTVPGSTGNGLTSKISNLNNYTPGFINDEDGLEIPTRLVAFYAVSDLIKTYHNVPVDEIVGFEDGAYVSQPNWETKYIDEIIVPISWATIHFQINSPNDETTFGADNEDYLTAYMAHKTKNFYDSKFLQNSLERDKLRNLEKKAAKASIFNPWIGGISYFLLRDQRKAAERRRNDWEKGSIFLSKFDELYRIMIGARYQEITSEVYYTTLCDCDDSNFPFLIDCDLVNELHLNILDCEEIIIVENEYYNLDWRNKDSDGVVLAESARDIPEDQSTWEPQRLDGVTHMQVRNTSHTAEMLKTVLGGEVGLFFYTETIED